MVAALFLPLLPASTTGIARGGVANGDRLLDERSPGRRPGGALFQTKPSRRVAALSPTGPQQRVLSTVRDRPGVPGLAFADPTAPFGAVPPIAAFAPPFTPGGLGGPAGAGPFGPNPILPGDGAGNVTPPGDGGVITPPPGDGGVVTPPPGDGGTVTPPVDGTPPGGPITPDDPGGPSVPEPSAWATMIVGLGLAGALLRRRRPACPVRGSR